MTVPAIYKFAKVPPSAGDLSRVIHTQREARFHRVFNWREKVESITRERLPSRRPVFRIFSFFASPLKKLSPETKIASGCWP